MAERAVNQFIRYLRGVRLYSTHTIVAYRSDLTQFESFMHDDILKVKRRDIKRYLRRLKSLELSPRSINRKLESLKSFFNFCARNSLVERSPCNSFRQEGVSKSTSGYLSKDKLIPILDSIVVSCNRRKLRDRVILEILYFTGCRVSELINIRKKCIDYAAHSIKVIGKGKVERLLHINNRLVTLIKNYQKAWKHRSRFLFTNDAGKKLYPVYIWRLVRRYFQPDILGKSVSPHTLRHSAATHLYQNGASMKSVKDFHWGTAHTRVQMSMYTLTAKL
ncbi:MAG: tyrosine-type recombinase/integrase [Bacteroidota bacterium]